MSLALDYSKLASNGNLTVFFYPSNAFANFGSPTVTELNAGLNLSKAVSWSDYSFGSNASNTSDDPSIADAGNSKARGSAQFGGSMSFFQPGPGTLTTDTYALVRNAISVPRTKGWIVTRLDGLKPYTQAFAAGDLVSVYAVLTDGYTNVMTGEQAFRYTVSFVQQGSLARNVVVRSAAATVAVTPTTKTMTVGSKFRFDGTVLGREYTNGLVWSTSDFTKATVSDAGVVTAIAAGTVTLTGTYTPTGATATSTITIS